MRPWPLVLCQCSSSSSSEMEEPRPASKSSLWMEWKSSDSCSRGCCPGGGCWYLRREINPLNTSEEAQREEQQQEQQSSHLLVASVAASGGGGAPAASPATWSPFQQPRNFPLLFLLCAPVARKLPTCCSCGLLLEEQQEQPPTSVGGREGEEKARLRIINYNIKVQQ